VLHRVQRNSGQTGLFRDSPRGFGHYIGPDVVSVWATEHEVEICAVIKSEHSARFFLPGLQTSQKLDSRIWEIQMARLPGLRFLDSQTDFRLFEALSDCKLSGVKIDVGPSERQQFAAPCSRR